MNTMTLESIPLYKGTILAIDDTPDNLHLLTEMLTEQGYKIRIIPNGKLALRSIANSPPDLILLDIVMPDMDGYQVCQQLKASVITQNIPVIFLSGLNETFDKVKAFEVGGVDYITKPFQVQEVLARVENQLRLQRLQQQLAQQNIQLQQEIQERHHAEIALSESEKKYRHLVEASQDLIWSVDRYGSYTFVNPIVQHLYGYSPEEMLGRSFTDFLSPERLEPDVNLFKCLLQGQSVFQYETTHLTKAGEPIQLLLNAIAVVDDQGQVVGVTGTASDITERQKAQEALRLSEIRYRELVEFQKQVLVCRWKPDTTLTFVNQSYCRFFGKSPAELIGTKYLELLPDSIQDQIRDFVKLLVNHECPETSEHIMISDQGELHWFKWTDQPILDEQGHILEIQSFGIDITTRKQAEEKLRLSEENLAQAQRIAHIGNWEFDVLTSQIIWSAELFRIFGLEPNQTEPTYQQLLDFIHPNDRSQFEETIKQSIEQGLCYELEFQILPRNRTTVRHLEVRIEPIFDQHYRIIKLFGTALDITQRQKAETALRQSEARERERAHQLQRTLEELKRTQSQLVQTAKMSSLGQMIAGIAHEINNPVSFIFGNITIGRQYFNDLIQLINLYQETYPNPPATVQEIAEAIDLQFVKKDWHKLLNSIQEGAERIHQIILSLRNFSRLDEAELKSVDIHQGIESTLFILQHRLKKPGNRQEIQVIKEYGQLPQVTCYANQLNQVFMNILANAIDAIDSHSSPGVITISTEVAGANRQRPPKNGSQQTDILKIRITDNGIGISEEVQPQIFDPFFTTKPVGSGTGLGLSISYQIIVEKHQGQLSCLSTPGEGTTFMIEIPLKPRSQQPREICLNDMDLAK
ncbi:MAG: PAS domain S-box protein [Coleofasciculus sp. G1-WW12-02]|uniref:PAS domain S-box protein n=1 Tax=Coleofasciculus sp. G1-WW12-02 TaxID=3068483 RepID=UPI0033013C76